MTSKANGFRDVTRVSRVGAGTYEATIPTDWQQGKGTFGGVIFGVLLRAACACEADPARVVRSFSADVAGPVTPGRARIRVRVLRRGHMQTNLRAELEQAGDVLASASITLSSARPVELSPYAPVPPQAARASFEAAPVHTVSHGGPMFAQFYEQRSLGPKLFSGSQAVTLGFVRERGAQGELDAAAITALLDSFWPALYYSIAQPLPFATVSFTAQYFQHDHVPRADEPLFFRAQMVAQRDGYCVEFRELWSNDRLLALNQQTFAVSPPRPAGVMRHVRASPHHADAREAAAAEQR